MPIVDRAFLDLLDQLEAAGPASERLEPGQALVPGSSLTCAEALRIFEAQVASRHLDFEARALRARGEGFYTISSAGHEANACVAAALRPTDPALLHYRSGPFFQMRAAQVPGSTPVFDVLLSMCASKEDPIAGGRHKVFGSRALEIPPQTSTIASHLPKALGLAVAIERARRLKLEPLRYPGDAIVCCSFGDASFNHATAQAALHTAGWMTQQRLPAPVLFVCEDNGIGISVRTPHNWVRDAAQGRAGLLYVAGDGHEIAAAYDAAQRAVTLCRERRRPVFLHLSVEPVFLHLSVERLLGHAGSDVETTYRAPQEIEAVEARDPLRAMAQQLCALGAARPGELRDLYERTRERVKAAGREAATRPRQTSLAEIVAPLAPLDKAAVAREARRAPDSARREAIWRGQPLPENRRPRHLAMLLNWALRDLMAKYPEMLIFGEDVGRKGGVYHVTADLAEVAGRARVFDTLLDETSILGLAMGAGAAGLLPCPEIQYLAYIHNALDQIRGEACSLQFFSDDRFRNPMVCRVASLGYQKGFGGHFHNDPSITALRDIPGLVIACPSRGDDAVAMLRTCFAAAKACGRVIAFLEPIALYMKKDVEPGDGAWLCAYPPFEPGSGETSAADEGALAAVPIGKARLYPAEGGTDGAPPELTIITYGNGLWLTRRAVNQLCGAGGARVQVLYLRWLNPLDEEAIVASARASGRRVLCVCEGRRSGGVAEAVMAVLAERLGAEGLTVSRVTGVDTFIPLGAAAELCLPSV
ncbi:MAG: thiamine pyrophosphate-dependent enzyme, partial [Planctomycetota bacterium]